MTTTASTGSPGTTGATGTTSAPGRNAGLLRPRDVADLTVASGYPCISVLMPTEPAARMTPADVQRLHGLAEDVDRQLRAHAVPGRTRLMRKLEGLVQRAAGQSTDASIAIYVNLATERVFRLASPVKARGVVEGTFATRDLVTALHRTPPHVVLVLHATCAHLYQAADGGLRSVGHRDLFRGPGVVRLPRQGTVAAEDVSQDVEVGFLRGVDRLLGSYRAEHPSPMVLAGTPDVVDRFAAQSRNLGRLAGRVAPSEVTTPLDLARASAAVVERYLKSRREEALRLLADTAAARPGDVASGMAQCWQQVHRRDPGMLLVEADYVNPGRPDDFGVPVPPQIGPSSRGVHDLVDDLIEVVIMRGGQLALVENGDLADHGRVALVCRT